MHGVGAEQPVELARQRSSASTPRAWQSAGSSRRAAFSVASSLPIGRASGWRVPPRRRAPRKADAVGSAPRRGRVSGLPRQAEIGGLSGLVLVARHGGRGSRRLDEVLDDANARKVKQICASPPDFQLTAAKRLPINPSGGPCRPTAGRFCLVTIHQSTIHLAQGGVPEWLKGTGCKPVGYAYVGSKSYPLHHALLRSRWMRV